MAARAALGTAAGPSARGSHAWGLFSPVRPSAWLLAEVDEIAARRTIDALRARSAARPDLREAA